MRKILLGINLFVFMFSYSQGIKFTYDYKLKLGDSITSQNVELYNENGKSYFYSDAKYKTDSILNDREKKMELTGNKMNFKNLPNDELVYFLEKQNSTGQVDFFSNEFEKNLKYSEENKFDWILDDDGGKKILNYTVKKATIKKYGKTFIAWYCPDIPINDGPYKFYGLPGLIFEIYDIKFNHHFTLIGIEKGNIDINLLFRKQKFIEVDKKKYSDFRNQYKKDPFQKIKSLIASTGISEVIGSSGNNINMTKIIAEREKKVIEKYKKDNQIEQ
ncbi:GLPGLI family protein [Frigoriflavimonas asaccharolytica]|uniref:GLPGLI family protein n=1 Tax=Frigoriflavimonas asaccharolytica TaxID=2735899 RepID=A0A8J8GA61_9FLAO|nr:GLPGLI family protein [Frigoriflavimonas asaccharolytica]NRS93908.1 GLPGLI family protein [Frigoriflavimonas asaccharolytica]